MTARTVAPPPWRLAFCIAAEVVAIALILGSIFTDSLAGEWLAVFMGAIWVPVFVWMLRRDVAYLSDRGAA